MKDWKIVTLGEICSFENGDRGENYPSKSVQTVSGIPFINAGHLSESGIDFSSMNYIPRQRFELLKKGKIQKDDILFCLRGSLGKVASVGSLSEGAIASSLVIIRSSSVVLNKFLLAYFQSNLCAEMIQIFRNGAAQPNLSAASLKKFRIPLPPLPEQKRIVAILDEAFEGIDRAIANTEKNLTNSRKLFESYLNAIFTQKGDGWVEKKLEDICSITSKLVDPRQPKFLDLPHIGAGNMIPLIGELVEVKTAREEELKSGKFLFDETMVLYSKIRPYLMKACRPEIKGLCSADVYPLLPNDGQLNRDFLFYLLMSRDFTNYAIAGSDRAGMPKVNRDHLFRYSTWFPSLSKQINLAKKIDEIASQTQRLEAIYRQKLAALNELKQSILQKAFTGEPTADTSKTAKEEIAA